MHMVPKFHIEKKTQTEILVIYNSIDDLESALGEGWELYGDSHWHKGCFRLMMKREKVASND